jgi:alpha-glucosidase
MPWDATHHRGFTTGEPWLPVDAAADGTAEQQAGDRASMLAWYQALIALRRTIDGDLEVLDAAPGVVAFRRGEHVIALNLGGESQPPPAVREVVLATPRSDAVALPPGGAIVAIG